MRNNNSHMTAGVYTLSANECTRMHTHERVTPFTHAHSHTLTHTDESTHPCTNRRLNNNSHATVCIYTLSANECTRMHTHERVTPFTHAHSHTLKHTDESTHLRTSRCQLKQSIHANTHVRKHTWMNTNAHAWKSYPFHTRTLAITHTHSRTHTLAHVLHSNSERTHFHTIRSAFTTGVQFEASPFDRTLHHSLSRVRRQQ